jgi:hypothetical protein
MCISWYKLGDKETLRGGSVTEAVLQWSFFTLCTSTHNATCTSEKSTKRCVLLAYSLLYCFRLNQDDCWAPDIPFYGDRLCLGLPHSQECKNSSYFHKNKLFLLCMLTDGLIVPIKFQGPMYHYLFLANNFEKILNIHKKTKLEDLKWRKYNFVTFHGNYHFLRNLGNIFVPRMLLLELYS